MLRLYASPGACSQISVIMLEKAQADFAIKLINLQKGEHKTSSYLSVNPRGKVPALIADNKLITETPAILLFLHKRYPEAGILPDTNVVDVFSDLAWFASALHPLITRYCKPGLLGVNAEAENVRQTAEQHLLDAFSTIEKHLNTTAWWNGACWDGVDAYLFWAVNRLERAGFSIAPFDAITRHYQCLLGDPVIKRALIRERALKADYSSTGQSN